MKKLEILQPSLEVRIEEVKEVEPHPTQPDEYYHITTTSGNLWTISASKKDMIKGLKKPGAKILVIAQNESYKLIYGPLDKRYMEQ